MTVHVLLSWFYSLFCSFSILACPCFMLDWICVVLWYWLLYFSFKPSSTADKSNIFLKTLFWLPQNVHGEWRCCWSQCQRAVVIIVVMTTCCQGLWGSGYHGWFPVQLWGSSAAVCNHRTCPDTHALWSMTGGFPSDPWCCTDTCRVRLQKHRTKYAASLSLKRNWKCFWVHFG